MEPVSRAELAIFIDAAVPEPLPPAGVGSPFTHHLTPQALVEGARSLYGRAAEPLVLTTTGQNFEFGESLSPAVERAIEETIRRVLGIVRQFTDCAAS